MLFSRRGLLALPFLLGPLALSPGMAEEAVQKIQSHGSVVGVDALKVPGKKTAIAFYSPGHEGAYKFDPIPILRRLGRDDPKLEVRLIEIDREGFTRPDVESPIARFYHLKEFNLPMLKIYNRKGRLLSRGDDAVQWVIRKNQKLPPPEAGEGPIPPASCPREVCEITNGNPVDIADYVDPEAKTIVMIFSPFCGPCKAVRPHLERLAEKKSDYVLRKIDINRPGTMGIDFRSPVARQYKVMQVPTVFVMNRDKEVEIQGQEALNQLMAEAQGLD